MAPPPPQPGPAVSAWWVGSEEESPLTATTPFEEWPLEDQRTGLQSSSFMELRTRNAASTVSSRCLWPSTASSCVLLGLAMAVKLFPSILRILTAHYLRIPRKWNLEDGVQGEVQQILGLLCCPAHQPEILSPLGLLNGPHEPKVDATTRPN